MGIASLVIGIWTVFLGFIPLLNYAVVIPALVGLFFGIVELRKLKGSPKGRGLSIAGTALNSIALLSVLIWTLIFSVGLSEVKDSISWGELNRDFGEYFDEESLGREREENMQERFQHNPFVERKFREKQPQDKKRYFKKEFKSEDPDSFHWRFERKYNSDNAKDLQKYQRDLIEEMRKDFQEHFRSNVPREFQKYFDFNPSSKSKKNTRKNKKENPRRNQFEQRYKEVI